ncbi:hypothetical protein [Microcoleus sp.]|uniref:hypothetical protein n=1 Tax=Microcoleus sp. TaxID=44472 RepID=UPI00403E3F32
MENLARQATVRIQTAKSSGSGTIVRRQGQTYTVLTNWHVVAIGLLSPTTASSTDRWEFRGGWRIPIWRSLSFAARSSIK